MLKTKEYQFHSDWFGERLDEWDSILPFVKARDRILEIGSFEGQSTCWFLEHVLNSDGELFAIDTWAGSPELFDVFDPELIASSFELFKKNVQLAKTTRQRVQILKGTSINGLAFLLSEQQNTFDLIFVDAAHYPAATLTDACMAWPLLRSGGVMVFDDYLWSLESPPLLTPKIAIDSFFTIFHSQLIFLFCGHQFAIKKK